MQGHIFNPPSQQELSLLYSQSPVYMVHDFSKHQVFDINQAVTLALTSTHVFVFQNQTSNIPKLSTPFTFQLKFQVLREEWKDQTTPGKPIGISFEKDNCGPIKFYANNPSVIEKWGYELERKINQRGFHKLFKAKRKIGKGAFATVYLAERLVDKKLVAVKAFSKERQYSSDKGRDSLINELNLMRKLKGNSNVINLEAVFQTENSIYVILQNLDGGQLHEKIKSGHKFKTHEIVQIMSCILKGLAFMDKYRVIHRDLKPENLLFRNKHSNEIVIADFGLATWAEEPHYLFVRCGTPGFVAPEIINIKDMSTHSDPISDVFSAGLIFHYLLFGKSVFKGSKYAEILAQNRSCNFQLFGSEYEAIDKNAYNLLARMLDVNPKTRIRAGQTLNHRFFQDAMEIESDSLSEKISSKYSFQQSSMNNSINPISFESSLQGTQVHTPTKSPRMSSRAFDNQNMALRKTVSNKENEKVLLLTPRNSHKRSQNAGYAQNLMNSESPRDFSKKFESSYQNNKGNSIHLGNLTNRPKQMGNNA